MIFFPFIKFFIPLFTGRILRISSGAVSGTNGWLIPLMTLLGLGVAVYLWTRRNPLLKRGGYKVDAIDKWVPGASGRMRQVIMEVSKIYTDTIGGLAIRDPEDLEKNMVKLSALEAEISHLSGDIKTVLCSPDKTFVRIGKPYISILDHLQGMIRSVGNVTADSYDHLKNHQRNLSFNQIRELRGIYERSECVFELLNAYFDNRKPKNIQRDLEESFSLFKYVSDVTKMQKVRLKDDRIVASNLKLYVNLLHDTRDLIGNTVNLICLLYELPPAKP